jgi:hypothetical protein
MKKLFLITLILAAQYVNAGSREMTGYVPSDALFIVGADFDLLRRNQLYVDLEKNGHIWSKDERSEQSALLQALNLEPQQVKAAIFVKYRNPYGNKGEINLYEVTPGSDPAFNREDPTPYLSEKLYRVLPDQDLYAVNLAPHVIAAGRLTGVKMAVDVTKGKAQAMGQNTDLLPLLEKVPQNAGVWGIAHPLTRRQAASMGADQSTNAVLEAFDHYYFFGVPSPAVLRSHFVGQAKGDSEAAFVRTFLIGTLTFAKFKSDNDGLSEALDQINVERNGKTIHVSAVVNKSMVDAYLDGQLGVE